MIFIVIPVFNRISFTLACLRSLQKQTFQEFKIIVVDHGSVDGTSEMVEREFPDTILLKGDESMWWAAATNLGVKKALEISTSDNDLILILNNDLEVNPDYLDELLKVYQQNKPCLVGTTSVYINNPEKISFVGVTWNRYTAKYKPNKFTSLPYTTVADISDTIPSDLLPGRGTLIPIVAFKKVGLFDENNFPHYAADEDFSFQCKKTGYAILVATKAVAKSHVAATGQNASLKNLSLLQFWNTLCAEHSAINFKTRYRWAIKNTTYPIPYFLFDMSRILGSYFNSKFFSI